MIRRRINDLLGLLGYRIVHTTPDIARDVSLGRYDWLRRREIRTVLDVGANIGQFSSAIRIILPGAHIHAFEPLQACYGDLDARSASLQPMTCHAFALGDSDGEATIHQNTAAASSSLLRLGRRHANAFPTARVSADESIQVRTLDAIAPELALSGPVLLKIDVQGYELHVLRGAEHTLPLVDTMILETSFSQLYEGQPLFDELYRYVTQRGFRYHGSIERIIDPANGEILQEDSLFMRPE